MQKKTIQHFICTLKMLLFYIWSRDMGGGVGAHRLLAKQFH
jgi:hypothetical protein